MKKIFSVLIALISTICIAFSFGGCEKKEEKKFYTVTEAYEEGLLTREQIMSIAYYHHEGTFSNEEIMGEDYTPLPLTPEELPAETVKALLQDHIDEDYPGTQYTVSDFKIDSYYGTYNGCVAVMIGFVEGGFYASFTIEEIAGIKIGYGDSNCILIWKNT